MAPTRRFQSISSVSKTCRNAIHKLIAQNAIRMTIVANTSKSPDTNAFAIAVIAEATARTIPAMNQRRDL